MNDFNDDDYEIDTSSTIKLVASVSFDRQKRQFKYSDGLDLVFGKEQADLMKMKQGTRSQHAVTKFT